MPQFSWISDELQYFPIADQKKVNGMALLICCDFGNRHRFRYNVEKNEARHVVIRAWARRHEVS